MGVPVFVTVTLCAFALSLVTARVIDTRIPYPVSEQMKEKHINSLIALLSKRLIKINECYESLFHIKNDKHYRCPALNKQILLNNTDWNIELFAGVMGHFATLRQVLKAVDDMNPNACATKQIVHESGTTLDQIKEYTLMRWKYQIPDDLVQVSESTGYQVITDTCNSGVQGSLKDEYDIRYRTLASLASYQLHLRLLEQMWNYLKIHHDTKIFLNRYNEMLEDGFDFHRTLTL